MATDVAGLAEDVFARLRCKDELTKSFIGIVLMSISVFDKKQQAYGTRNISVFGEMGVLIRSHDKMARLINLTKNGANPPEESVDDSWLDLGTYSFIALMIRNGLWPGVEGK